MTILTIPPDVAAAGAKKLFPLAETANRDAMTLIKQAMALAKNEHVSRPLGILRKYVREHDQYGSGEVSEIIASIETAADPKHIKRLARAAKLKTTQGVRIWRSAARNHGAHRHIGRQWRRGRKRQSPVRTAT